MTSPVQNPLRLVVVRRPPPSGLRRGESLAALLDRNVGCGYCRTCLARFLEVDHDHVRDAAAALRMTGRYSINAFCLCSACGRRLTTVQADGGPAGAATRAS